MANPLSYNIKEIFVGFKYKNFKITAIAGQMIDEILYGKDTPFGAKFFPSVGSSLDEKTLKNEDTEDYLTISSSDLLLRVGVTGSAELNPTLDKVTNYYYPFLIKLIGKYKISNISRIGVVFKHDFKLNNNLEEYIKKFTGNQIVDPNAIRLSFSKKYKTNDGLAKLGLDDYINTIYTITDLGGYAQVDFDYQKGFDPIAEDIDSCNANEIVTAGKNALHSQFYPWIKSHLNENE